MGSRSTHGLIAVVESMETLGRQATWLLLWRGGVGGWYTNFQSKVSVSSPRRSVYPNDLHNKKKRDSKKWSAWDDGGVRERGKSAEIEYDAARM